jgi:HEAT repeat protein
VGWDDRRGKGCWHIQNSWGLKWGEGGGAWIEYGSNNIGVGAFWLHAQSIQYNLPANTHKLLGEQAEPFHAWASDSVEAEAAQLSAELVQAKGKEQDRLLEKLKDSKGLAYTEALASAIPKLTGAPRSKARDALAQRLTRMAGETLGEKLQDEDAEIRRAAALACAMKEEKSHIPKLIEMLKDPEPPSARAAYAALKSLTDQDFGPPANASATDREKAVAAWKSWWQKNKKP